MSGSFCTRSGYLDHVPVRGLRTRTTFLPENLSMAVRSLTDGSGQGASPPWYRSARKQGVRAENGRTGGLLKSVNSVGKDGVFVIYLMIQGWDSIGDVLMDVRRSRRHGWG